MSNNTLTTAFLQPLAGGSLSHWFRVLRAYGGIAPMHCHKALFITVMTMLSAPLRAAQSVLYHGKLRHAELDHPPVFVIGHWRSGTTFLHNLLSQDPRFGYVSTLQTVVPDGFLLGEKALRPILGRLLPERRPQDDLELSLDYPMEEEIAVATCTPYSYYHVWFFPSRVEDLIPYLSMRGVSDRVRTSWEKVYVRILRQAAFRAQGRQLVLKNPVNTGRIPFLLKLFPDAKFIHIYRNPYVVFPSTKRLYQKILAISALQNVEEEEIERIILRVYTELMQRFFEDKHLIPEGQLAETRFEDLEIDPLAELERVYRCLGMSFDAAREPCRDYLARHQGYKKNTYVLPPETIEKVKNHWGFTIDAWQYEQPYERVGPT